MSKGLIIEHIKNHIEYPATADELKMACQEMAELGDKEKEWIKTHLPDSTYNSPDEVLRALGWRGIYISPFI